jgi:hypothetical protein
MSDAHDQRVKSHEMQVAAFHFFAEMRQAKERAREQAEQERFERAMRPTPVLPRRVPIPPRAR